MAPKIMCDPEPHNLISLDPIKNSVITVPIP